MNRTILLFLLSVRMLLAQTQTITGRVHNDLGQPLPNTNIVVVPDGTGSITDSQGNFSLQVTARDTLRLRITHIGYQGVNLVEPLDDGVGPYTVQPVILTSQAIEIEAITITSVLSSRSKEFIDQPVNLVSRGLIMARNPKSTAEALREETGVFIQKTGHGGGSPIIRGFGSNQVLILVDGVRLNNSTYRLGNHQYLTTVDYNALERIEIIRGPSSTLYGSDAIGGVINLITQMPSGGSDAGPKFDFQGRYATVDEERMGHLGGQFSMGQVRVMVGASIKLFGDLRRGSNTKDDRLLRSPVVQNPTAFSAYDVDLKAHYRRPGSVRAYTAVYQRSRQFEVPRYDKYENNGYYRWLYDPQERDLFYLAQRRDDGGQATFSIHRQGEGHILQRQAGSATTYESDQVLTLGLNYHEPRRWGRHQFMIGAQGYGDLINSSRVVEDGGTETQEASRYPDGSRYLNLGLFVQDEFDVGPFSARAGLRYNAFMADNMEYFGLDLNPETFKSQAITGSFGLSYPLGEGLVISGHVGQAFRAPNMSDMGKLGESKGDTYEVPNFDLKPERSINYNLQAKVNKSAFRASLSVHYATITDLLASVPSVWNGDSTITIDGAVYQIRHKENLGQAKVYGVEGDFGIDLPANLTLSANGAVTYGDNITAGEPVGGIPPLFGTVDLTWRSDGNSLSGFVRFNGEQTKLSADDLDDPRILEGGTPAWWTLNFRGRHQLTRTVALQLSLENVFDLNYRQHGSGLNAPGRNFIFSLRYSG